MEGEAPSWADQWGAGGIGAIVEDDNTTAKKDGNNNKKGSGKDGFSKAKDAALKGAKKLMIKMGVSKGKKSKKNDSSE
ncbi:hypothetical protein SLA2020_259710 [Shorea laevis]